MFPALMLLAAVSLPSPAQQQRAAAAVYQLFYHVTATGSFTYEFGAGKPLHLEEQDVDFALASAVAVDPDGWLLTARHAADVDQLAHEFCDVMERRWMRYRVDKLVFGLTITDIVGNQRVTQIAVTPPAGSRYDVCHSSGPLTVIADAVFRTRIVALDDNADVALLKLDTSSGPVVAMPWGTSAMLQREWPAYGFGFVDRGGMAMRGGYVAIACEDRIAELTPAVDLGPGIVRAKTERVMRFVMDGQPGMSGGPVAFGNSLVGIIVRAGATEENLAKNLGSVPLTMAVPSDYARAWYRHVRWPQRWPAPKDVCVSASGR